MGSPSALWATASYGAGDFGDEISSSELREQLSVFESQLANAMNRGRYEEAKQLVNEITALKEFMEKQAAAAASGGFRNPFAGAFEPFQAATALDASPAQRSAARSSKSGLGAFGTGLSKRAGRGLSGKVAGVSREPWGRRKEMEVPMEAVRKRHSDITAYGIRVEVFCFFQPGASRPEDNLYSFQCNIRITNTNPTDVQLLGRELKIFKADGSPPEYGPASQQLESQPVVGPGSVYMYMSEFGITCVPEDKKYLGRIEGHFNVAVEGALVKVPIAPFWLEIPGDTLVLA